MARELEVKVLGVDKYELEKSLIDLGATLIKRERQVNTVFMDIDEDIEDVGEGYLRIRESENLETGETSNTLTFKKNISQDGFRENEEIETKVEDRDAMLSILACLNIHIKHIGEKTRVRYELEGIRFDIDTWDQNTYPNTYMEIEVKDPKDIDKAIRLLKIDQSQVTTKSLKELRHDIGN